MPQIRKLAAIMFTDIVGYTKLMGSDEDKAMDLLHLNRELQKPLVEKHGGQWLKEMGDGALASFPTASAAIYCAREIQKGAFSNPDLTIRIGIHLGEVTLKDGDVYGDGVNIASRLESIADPGGVYFSESIHKAVKSKKDIQSHYLGELELKNIDYPVKTYALSGEGLPVPGEKISKGLKGGFAAEIRRRGIVRVAITYSILALLVYFVIEYFEFAINPPAWFDQAYVVAALLGFLLALFLAWNYEHSPDGFVRTTSQQSWQNPLKASQRKPFTSNFVIIGLLVVVIAVLVSPRDVTNPTQDSATASEFIVIDKSIAVLPFINDSPDEDNQYFCDGMMDEILNHLQKIEELGVKSRTAVEAYRNSTQSIASIAGELDVTFLLEGAVRKYGNNFRLTTQLIDVASGNHLWSDTYDGVFSDTIFVIQSSIAKKVAASLDAVITPQEERSIDKIPTTEIAAYDLYIQAQYERKYYWKTRDKKHLKRAHDLLDKALQIDPDYLGAINSIGATFMAEQNCDSAFVYADRVLELDPKFFNAYGLKGECYRLMGRYDLAIENYLKAIHLQPENSENVWYHVALGFAYCNKGELVKGLPYLEKGLEQSSDVLPLVYLELGRGFLNIGDYVRAEEYLQKCLELSDNCYNSAHWSWSLKMQGKYQEAIRFIDSTCPQTECDRGCYASLFELSLLLNEFEQAEQYFKHWQNTSIEGNRLQLHGYIDYEIGYVYYQLGKITEAERIFSEQIPKLLSFLDQNIEVGHFWSGTNLYLARIYAFQGNRNKAIKYLTDYAREGFRLGWHDFIMIDPFFESLRTDPEFLSIVWKAQEEKAALRMQVKEMEESGELDFGLHSVIGNSSTN